MSRSRQNIPQPARRSSAKPGPTPRRRAASKELSSRFAEALARLGWRGETPAALAVSGGGDSLALMHLFAAWTKDQGAPAPVVLCVDHALRQESAVEAARVQRWAKSTRLAAHILRATGKKPKTGLEAHARNIRYRLMGDWCRAHGICALFVAHTLEDQAETFLLRLARGSGVDGLSAMQARAPFPDPNYRQIVLYRPLLDMCRSELRAFLASRRQPWIEDPMNEDVRFARTRVRALFPVLEAAGLPAGRIVGAANHLARAREALEVSAASLMTWAVHFDAAGYAVVDATALTEAPREIGLRALAAILLAISGNPYRPRFERLEHLYDAIAKRGLSGGRTLHGCRVAPAPKLFRSFGERTLLVSREPREAVRAPDVLLTPGNAPVWDGRFKLTLAAESGIGRVRVAALGDQPALAEQLSHIPPPARAGLPGLWRGRALLAAPHAAPGGTPGLMIEFLSHDTLR